MARKKLLLLLSLLLLFSCIPKKRYVSLSIQNKQLDSTYRYIQTQQEYRIIILTKQLDSLQTLLLDTDRDGVIDRIDDCPSVYGSKPNRGCPEISNGNVYEDLIEFCCSNHNPGHCAKRTKEMKEMCLEYNCIFK